MIATKFIISNEIQWRKAWFQELPELSIQFLLIKQEVHIIACFNTVQVSSAIMVSGLGPDCDCCILDC